MYPRMCRRFVIYLKHKISAGASGAAKVSGVQTPLDLFL